MALNLCVKQPVSRVPTSRRWRGGHDLCTALDIPSVTHVDSNANSSVYNCPLPKGRSFSRNAVVFFLSSTSSWKRGVLLVNLIYISAICPKSTLRRLYRHRILRWYSIPLVLLRDRSLSL